MPATDEGLASDADELSETARRTLLVALADDGHAGVYRGGRLYLEGRVPDEATSIELETTAAEVIGAENVENNYEIDPSVGQITDGIVIIDEPFLFGKNSAAITAEYNEILDLGVLVMKLNPGATFNVVGHADSNGSLSENQRLSDERAQAVANYLIEREIEMEKVTGGYGAAIGFVNDFATPTNTKKSWDMVARYVVPEVQGQLDSMRESNTFVRENREYFDRAGQAILNKINENERAAEIFATQQSGATPIASPNAPASPAAG